MAVKLSRRAKQIARELGIDAATINGQVFLSAKQNHRLLLKELETTLKLVSKGSKTGSLGGYTAKVLIEPLKPDANGIHSYALIGYVEASPAHQSLDLNVFDLLDTGRKGLSARLRDGYIPKLPPVNRATVLQTVTIRGHNRPHNGKKARVTPYTQVRKVRADRDKMREDRRKYNGQRGAMPMWNLSRRLNVQGRNTVTNRGREPGVILRHEPRAREKFLNIGLTLVPFYNKSDRSNRVQVSVPIRVTRPQMLPEDNNLLFVRSVAPQAALNLYSRTFKRYKDKLAQDTFKDKYSGYVITQPQLLRSTKRRRRILSPSEIDAAALELSKLGSKLIQKSRNPLTERRPDVRNRDLFPDVNRKVAREITRLFNKNRGAVSLVNLNIEISIESVLF